MDDKKYFEDLDPKTFTEQDWQDIFDLLERNPEKFRAMFRDEKVAAESEETLKRFLRNMDLDKRITSKMEELDAVNAPESVKDFWSHMICSADAEEERKTYIPNAERMAEIDAFWNMLHKNFDKQEEDEIQEGDVENPFSEQYLGTEYVPPTFKRNRKNGLNCEEITLSFPNNYAVFDILDWEEYTGIYPDTFASEYDGCLKLRFTFFDAYTESEQQ